VTVEMQQISEGLNKMKRSLFRGIMITTKPTSGDQLQEKIQKWLSPPDPSINHNVACEAHHTGTATWFLEGAVYNEWKTAGSLMWMHGKRTGFHPLPDTGADELLLLSGFGKNCPLVRDASMEVFWQSLSWLPALQS
jgi:hypothetical protein